MKEIQAIVRRLISSPRSPGDVLATLVEVDGSSYRRPGARLLVGADGSRVGSISGGCLEEDVIARAAQVATTGRPEMVIYDTTSENDLVWGVGLGCHGIVRVFLEPLPMVLAWPRALSAGFQAGTATPLRVTWAEDAAGPRGTDLDLGEAAGVRPGVFRQLLPPPTALNLFGAGDDARPLVRLTKELGWTVTVADPRPAATSAARFPEADRLVTGPADRLVEAVDPRPGSLAVVMTHHYVHDVPLLRDLLARPLAYLGLLGPKQRAEKILADLAAAGATITAEHRRVLHAPVGLDLGGDGPEEVALSILAEMRAVLSGRDGRPLRERRLPIHG